MREITSFRNIRGLCYISSPLAEEAAGRLSAWGSFSCSVPARQWKFSGNSAFPRSCHETAVSANWNFRCAAFRPFLRLLSKHPRFALHHTTHFAEGTRAGVCNAECCTWTLEALNKKRRGCGWRQFLYCRELCKGPDTFALPRYNHPRLFVMKPGSKLTQYLQTTPESWRDQLVQ